MIWGGWLLGRPTNCHRLWRCSSMTDMFFLYVISGIVLFPYQSNCVIQTFRAGYSHLYKHQSIQVKVPLFIYCPWPMNWSIFKMIIYTISMYLWQPWMSTNPNTQYDIEFPNFYLDWSFCALKEHEMPL